MAPQLAQLQTPGLATPRIAKNSALPAFLAVCSALPAFLAVCSALATMLAATAHADEDGPSAGDADAKPSAAATDDAKRGTISRELAEQGEADLQKSVRAFQQRYLVKAGRVELQLGGATTVADPMVHHYSTDATLLVHLSERLAIGAGASQWHGQATDQFNQIERDFGLFPEKSVLQAGAHGQVQLSPVVGKFSSFGLAVLQVDGYMILGGGAARTTRGVNLKPFGLIGAGLRVHTLRWLTIGFEVRDMIMNESFISESRLLQHVFCGAQIGIWIPPSVTYKFAR